MNLLYSFNGLLLDEEDVLIDQTFVRYTSSQGDRTRRKVIIYWKIPSL